MADVMDAFLCLVEEIQDEINSVKQIIRQRADSEHFDEAEEASQRARQMKDILWRVVSSGQEWNSLFSSEETEDDAQESTERRDLGRLQRGLRESKEEAYYRPILEILEETGGSARTSEVIERIPQKMKKVLQDVDYHALPSDPDSPRWKNSARWARLTLVRRGLLRDDTPKGKHGRSRSPAAMCSPTTTTYLAGPERSPDLIGGRVGDGQIRRSPTPAWPGYRRSPARRNRKHGGRTRAVTTSGERQPRAA